MLKYCICYRCVSFSVVCSFAMHIIEKHMRTQTDAHTHAHTQKHKHLRTHRLSLSLSLSPSFSSLLFSLSLSQHLAITAEQFISSPQTTTTTKQTTKNAQGLFSRKRRRRGKRASRLYNIKRVNIIDGHSHRQQCHLQQFCFVHF